VTFRLVAVLLGVATSLVLLLFGAAPASAHGGATPDVVSVAQTLGRHELTVTMYPPMNGAGPMPVRIIAHGGAPEGPLLLKAIPGAGGPTSQAVVAPSAGPGSPATGTLQIDRPGAWEVVLVNSPDVARIPLAVPAAPPTPAWVWAVRVGAVAAALGAIGASAAWRRRPQAALGLGAGALVGGAVAATAALLSTSIAAPDAVSAPTSHPAAHGTGSGAVVVTANLQPAPDGLVELTLGLTDGSTGARVDDLAIHDDALIHLAVIGAGGRLWHVHPVRTAPGRFSVRLPVSAAGRYGIFAELERADGGHQVARSAFTLAADRPSAPAASEVAAPQGPGSRAVAGMRVDVTAGPLLAGRESRVDLAFSENGQPVRDLQSWLGMGGHLMVLGPSAGAADPDPADPATSFAHLHFAGPPVQYGYGPNIAFTYAFPAGGRYQLWAQVQRGWQLVTIPITVDVSPMPTGT
jgi:hypothetical protein